MEDTQHTFEGDNMDIVDSLTSAEMVVADVDGTLNAVNVLVGGQKIFVPSLKASGREAKILSAEYEMRDKADFAHFFPLEYSDKLSDGEKLAEMRKWWLSQFASLKQENLTMDKLGTMMNWEGLQLRKGWVKLMDICRDLNIPFVFLSSAGLGVDSIRMLLEREGLMSPNVHIVSNQILWDENGVMTGHREPIMTSHMDKQAFLLEAGIKIPSKVVVIGNSLGDAKMVNDAAGRKVYRFGICQMKPGEDYASHAKNWARFEKVFDRVLADDEMIKPIINRVKNFDA